MHALFIFLNYMSRVLTLQCFTKQANSVHFFFPNAEVLKAVLVISTLSKLSQVQVSKVLHHPFLTTHQNEAFVEMAVLIKRLERSVMMVM